jgi:hypothetical protein
MTATRYALGAQTAKQAPSTPPRSTAENPAAVEATASPLIGEVEIIRSHQGISFGHLVTSKRPRGEDLIGIPSARAPVGIDQSEDSPEWNSQP